MSKLSFEELEKILRDAEQQVPLGSKWRHYKGGEYEISKHAILEESQKVAVVYTSLAHPSVSFVRPLSIWQEIVEWNGKSISRFSRF